MTNNPWNGVRPLEALARFVVKEYRTWCPIDTMRSPEMIRTEQHGSADLGFSKAVSARRGVIRDPAMQRIIGIIRASLPEPDGARSVHWNAAKTEHRTAFEMRYDRPKYDPGWGVFLPACCFLIQMTFCWD
jgi:hypothetical protein